MEKSQLHGKEAITFDDISLIPAYSEVTPDQVLLNTLLGDVMLRIPILSAAMDTVTEYKMGVALSLHGGIGVIHRNMTYEEQIQQVRKVKRHSNRIIYDPMCVKREAKIGVIADLAKSCGFSSFPVTSDLRIFVGEISDIDFTNIDLEAVVERKMRDKSELSCVTLDTLAIPNIHEACENAYHVLCRLMMENRHRAGYFLNHDDKLVGMITRKDVSVAEQYPEACKDHLDRLVCAAAVSVSVSIDHILALIENGVDMICVDSAHGNSKNVVEAVARIDAICNKSSIVKLPTIMAGNVVDADGVGRLADAGADIIKLSVGAGSICSTRIVAGVGVPALTTIEVCAAECDRLGVSCVADGGMRTSGDIVKALAFGADAVMLGSMLAGVDESPAEIFEQDGGKFCKYVGMGHISRLKKYSERYGHKAVSEGVECSIPYKGQLSTVLGEIVGGIRSGMGYMGAYNIPALQTKCQYVRVTNAGVAEAHPHIFYQRGCR